MNVRHPLLALALALAALAACDGGGASSGTTPSADPAATASATAEPTASATATAEPTASAEAEGDGGDEGDEGGADAPDAADTTAPQATAKGTPDPKATATPTATASADDDPKKKWSCGNKGQKACPMQGWMKGVMARAMASGDGEKIAKALNTIAAKPVAGYGQWTGIAAEGASKAQAGDIDGAKASCKKCHALYQKKYIATLRDQPW